MLVANRYRLGESIARGGMGEVFRAVDEQLGRAVALKLLLPSRDEHAGERFHREAQAAARLNDPQVVSVYDFGQHGDGFFLVMELVEGGTVGDELAQYGTLSKERAIDIVEQAAAGLAAAHQEDVVHRDVKPGNLLLTVDGTVKVADFGIAHMPTEESTALTATGQLIGSTHYLAPERASGGQAVQASDVYSLGCVLYQLVTGQPPFKAEHPTAILYQHVDAAPEPPSLTRPELAGQFEAVLLRMLAKDPAERPSAAEIAAGALRGETLSVVPILAAEALVPEEDRPVIGPTDPGRVWTRALVAALIALVVAAGTVLAVVLNGNETQLPPTTEINPPAGATSSTPMPGSTASSATTSKPGTAGQSSATPTTTSPSPSVSTPTATPSTSPSATSPGPTAPSSKPTSTPPSSAPTRSTPTPTAPTRTPSSTPSTSPPPDTPPTATPASAAPPSSPAGTPAPAAD